MDKQRDTRIYLINTSNACFGHKCSDILVEMTVMVMLIKRECTLYSVNCNGREAALRRALLRGRVKSAV